MQRKCISVHLPHFYEVDFRNVMGDILLIAANKAIRICFCIGFVIYKVQRTQKQAEFSAFLKEG